MAGQTVKDLVQAATKAAQRGEQARKAAQDTAEQIAAKRGRSGPPAATPAGPAPR